MDLVRCVSVPDNELAVLRGRDEVSAVGRPVHGVDLCKMTLERALRLHCEAWQGLDTVAGNIADCSQLLAVHSTG